MELKNIFTADKDDARSRLANGETACIENMPKKITEHSITLDDCCQKGGVS